MSRACTRALRRRHAALVAGVATVVISLAAAACGARPPLALGTGAVSDCYRAIPVAATALHDDHSSFLGVKRVAADVIEHRFPGTASRIENDTQVCALAFRGSFTSGQVDGAPGSEHGSYAVVLISSRHLKLLRSFVGARLPERFTHRLS